MVNFERLDDKEVSLKNGKRSTSRLTMFMVALGLFSQALRLWLALYPRLYDDGTTHLFAWVVATFWALLIVKTFTAYMELPEFNYLAMWTSIVCCWVVW